MPQVINRLYQSTLKRIPGVDRSAAMQWIKHSYYLLLTAAHRTRESRISRRFIRSYSFSSEQQRAFAFILEQLEIPFALEQLLPLLTSHMQLASFNNLLALLDFVIRHSFEPLGNRHAGDIRNAAEYATEVCPSKRERNILFITGAYPSLMHGGGARLIDFIKIMSRDNNLYLYSWSDGTQDAAARQILQACCHKVEQVLFLDFEGNFGRVSEFIGDVSMDLVHYEWPRSLTNYNPAWGKYHIFTYMEVVSLRLRMDLTFQTPLRRRWLQTLIDLFNALRVEVVDAAQADFHIVVTRKDGEFLSQFTPGRQYAILNHGINPDEFCLPDRTPELHTLVFTGNYRHYPNEDAVVFFLEKIFKSVRNRIPDVQVYLVGAHPSERVMHYHDDRHVFVTGAVDDIRPYIQRASVCIAPLISGAGIRSKVIQYAALKRVCVATSIAATDLVFENGRDILITDDPSTFADHLISLLEHPERARQMAESAYAQARLHYDNHRLVQDLYGVYQYLEARQGKN